MIKFACISPHPPLLLPNVGSKDDKQQVKKTIESLESLGKLLAEKKPDSIIISSPHPDWGFNVPLHFLAKNLKGEIRTCGLRPQNLDSLRYKSYNLEIKTYLTGFEPPKFSFNKGREFYKKLKENQNYALIASGDLSHCLKEDGPYGFNPDGPKFDKALMEFLKKKDIKNFLKLDEKYPKAGECGLRSFSFLLGILEEAKINWQPKILSYEAPFGVGYLVANFKL